MADINVNDGVQIIGANKQSVFINDGTDNYFIGNLVEDSLTQDPAQYEHLFSRDGLGLRNPRAIRQVGPSTIAFRIKYEGRDATNDLLPILDPEPLSTGESAFFTLTIRTLTSATAGYDEVYPVTVLTCFSETQVTQGNEVALSFASRTRTPARVAYSAV